MTFRTWMAEALVVGTVLAAVAALTGGAALQWLSALAVLLSFMHAQVADRMAEKQAAAVRPDVACWRWSGRYFLAKELTWCAVFASGRAWPALAGVGLFLAYPAWRRYHRSRSGPFPCQDGCTKVAALAILLAALSMTACGPVRLPCAITRGCPAPTPTEVPPGPRPTPTPMPQATPTPVPTPTPEACQPPTIREWGVAGSCHNREVHRWPDGVSRDSCLVDSTIHFFGAIACDSDHPFAVCCGRSWDNADGPMWTITAPYFVNPSNPWQVWVEARGQVSLRACPPQPFFTPDGIAVPVAYGGACGTRTLDFDKGVD